MHMHEQYIFQPTEHSSGTGNPDPQWQRMAGRSRDTCTAGSMSGAMSICRSDNITFSMVHGVFIYRCTGAIQTHWACECLQERMNGK